VEVWVGTGVGVLLSNLVVLLDLRANTSRVSKYRGVLKGD